MKPKFHPNRTFLHYCLAFAILLSACAESARTTWDSASPPAESLADATAEAVATGRADMIAIERKIVRHSQDGETIVERSIAIPQFTRKGPGIERVNGFIRYLALHWPDLPEDLVWETERPAEPMRRLAAKLKTLRPEDWPALARLQALEEPLEESFLDPSWVPYRELTTFEIQIMELSDEKTRLRFEIYSVAASSSSYIGELSIDLATGEAMPDP